jgi:hypothetical protein
VGGRGLGVMPAIQDDVDGATYRADEKPGAPHGDCIGYATPKMSTPACANVLECAWTGTPHAPRQ